MSKTKNNFFLKFIKEGRNLHNINKSKLSYRCPYDRYRDFGIESGGGSHANRLAHTKNKAA